MDDRTIAQHIEDRRCSLRDELHRGGLAHTEAARTLDKRVNFLDDTPDPSKQL